MMLMSKRQGLVGSKGKLMKKQKRVGGSRGEGCNAPTPEMRTTKEVHRHKSAMEINAR